MTLLELKDRVDDALERAKIEGQNPDTIPVTLQLENGEKSVWGHGSMEVVWDNNTQATGCVIIADLDDEHAPAGVNEPITKTFTQTDLERAANAFIQTNGREQELEWRWERTGMLNQFIAGLFADADAKASTTPR